MISWISDHHSLLSIALDLVSAVVWVVYLQILVIGFLRQRRTNILIHRSAGHDDSARLVVSNMGAEPVYVNSVIVDFEIDEDTHSAVVTDREDIPEDNLSSSLDRTTQGTLNSGQSRDVGSFSDLHRFAAQQLGLSERLEEIHKLTVTVATDSGHDTFLSAGRQSFNVVLRDGRHYYLPASVLTKQIRSRRERSKLRKRLNIALEEEAKQYQCLAR